MTLSDGDLKEKSEREDQQKRQAKPEFKTPSKLLEVRKGDAQPHTNV